MRTRRAWAAMLALAASAAMAPGQESQPADRARAAVVGVVDWLARQAVPVPGARDAVLFPETAGGNKAPTAIVYGGTAGVLIFLENAGAVLDDDRARKLADATARGLMAIRRSDAHGVTWSRGGRRECASALYTGDAGVGHAFLVRARIRKDADALTFAREVGNAILARGVRGEDGSLHWPDREVDVIFGAAGTLLYLLELGAETDDRRFTDGALAAARWLIRVASDSGADAASRRLFWPCPMFGNEHTPNFSHGTAGVAYALARVAAATGDAASLQAARDGAAWLEDHAIREGERLNWPLTAGERRVFGGWCHGPPGTARLFLLLHALTGEERYLEPALASARWLMAYGAADTRRQAAPEFNLTLCCGVAGVLDFFCDLHRTTGDPVHADFARRAGDYLVARATKDDAGVRWRSSARGPASFGVDLMQGASGHGLSLLRLLTLDRRPDPIQHLPDRRISAQ